MKEIKYNKDRMRSYASIFSGAAFTQLLKTDDVGFISKKVERYDQHNIGKKFKTYSEYLSYIYNILVKEYRCEYVYKNEIINELLLKKYGTHNAVVINEFKVGNSVADMVLFNGTSKAFEIKTELDTDKRLNGQLADYRTIFRESYIVTHESLVDKYLNRDTKSGLIAIEKQGRGFKMTEVRKAEIENEIDSDKLMRSLRTDEYKNIIITYYGNLPDVSTFQMFNVCNDLMRLIPATELHQLFINEVKKRKSNTAFLKNYYKEIRQVCLSMHIQPKDYTELNQLLSQTISI